MNRRSFINYVLAGLGALPLIGKLIRSRFPDPSRTFEINGMPIVRFADSDAQPAPYNHERFDDKIWVLPRETVQRTRATRHSRATE